MPKTIINTTGDGSATTLIQSQIQLPDSGTSVLIGGMVDPSGVGGGVAITGSPLTVPAAPGSGVIYYIIQVHTGTGVASVKQSTSSMPTADASNQIVFSTVLQTTDTNPALDADTVTPDNY